jgi:hypothetical protein
LRSVPILTGAMKSLGAVVSGSGGRAAAESASRGMVEDSTNSTRKGKRHMQKTSEPSRGRKSRSELSKADTLSMLDSALTYMARAGWDVQLCEVGGQATVTITGAQLVMRDALPYLVESTA